MQGTPTGAGGRESVGMPPEKVILKSLRDPLEGHF